MANELHASFHALGDPTRLAVVEMLLDGPAVLGREAVDEIDRETSSDELKIGLEAAMQAGEFRALPLEELTAQLSAMFDRAALGIANGDRKEDHIKVFQAVFDGLKA